jgi:hypothetical protein
MEAILDFYNTAPEPGVVRLAFDERPTQLIADVVAPLPMEKGKSKRMDSEYKRNGTCNILLAYQLDQGQRYVKTTKTRTKADFAQYWDEMEAIHFSHYQRIDVVLDNLNTHEASSFYEHLRVERADELRRKIRFIYTPKKGSWLNVSEMEFAAFSKQCLAGRRIGSLEEMTEQAEAWCQRRNQEEVKVNWTFTKARAREKLKRSYDKLLENKSIN